MVDMDKGGIVDLETWTVDRTVDHKVNSASVLIKGVVADLYSELPLIWTPEMRPPLY